MPLVFDIGLHRGDDTAYLLHRGHRVVAVDADERMVESARQRFAREIEQGRLTLVHAMVGGASGTGTFHLSDETLWSSAHPQVAGRNRLSTRPVTVPAVSLAFLIEQYGCPEYAKIDIEGNDAAALASLEPARARPRFVSVETECLGDAEAASESRALETFDHLVTLGYDRFKLVDQSTLEPLRIGEAFYSRLTRERQGLPRLLRKARTTLFGIYRDLVGRQLGFRFPPGASGPFGDEIPSPWLAPDGARRLLLAARADYMNQPWAKPFGFWCDWHATRSGR
jgi:FkbM family methyltransferase